VNADGDLVVHAEYWLSEADHLTRPGKPREAHDHLWRHVDPVTRERSVVGLRDSNLGAAILAVLTGHLQGNGPWPNAVRAHPRLYSDPYGWLSHPFVRALEITPHV
jgi:hypothetical protein